MSVEATIRVFAYGIFTQENVYIHLLDAIPVGCLMSCLTKPKLLGKKEQIAYKV